MTSVSIANNTSSQTPPWASPDRPLPFYALRGPSLAEMRNFWALPAVLRIALASPHAFSVFDDILAFPQYEVVFPNTFITERSASSLLANAASRLASSDSQQTQDLFEPRKRSSASKTDDELLEETYERVVLDGQRYLCSIPVIPEEPPQNATAPTPESKEDEMKELARAEDRGWELLSGMDGFCIYYISGWWSYSFCYNGEVRQFHPLPPSKGVPFYPPVEDTSVQSYVLGRFPTKSKDAKKGDREQKMLDGQKGDKEDEDDEDEEAVTDPEEKALARLETRGGARYMVQRLEGGTECDLTGEERKIDVEFHCHPSSSDKIDMIKEMSTCNYLMVIHTPRLCNDVAFLPPQDDFAHPISCRPVVPDAEADTWTMQKLEGRIRESERIKAVEERNPLREILEGAAGYSHKLPIIGGIVVGGQRLVGSEGRVIEPSVVVGGGKETVLATIFNWKGLAMSRAEMKKLEIHNPEKVEEWKEEQKRREEPGKKWRIDLIETPQGREFRWIVETDEDEVEGTKKKGKSEGGETKEKSGSKEGKKAKGREASKERAKPKKEKSKQKQKPKQAEEEVGEGEEQQEGSEEVYKDEL